MTGVLQAQADGAATRSLVISAFGGLSGVFTGLDTARNLSITGGVDLGFHPFYGLLPAVEVRGMYPVDGGSLIQEKNILGGFRLEKRRGRFRLYGDALFGRGQIDYLNGGFFNSTGTYRYETTSSNVFSAGAGASLDLTPQIAVFVDAQFQRYATPVTASGYLWSKPVTVGVTYRLPALRHGRPY